MFSLLICTGVWAKEAPLRLPDDATPVHEAVHFWFDPKSEVFRAEADLTVALHGVRRSLEVNAKELTFAEISVRQGDRVKKVRAHASKETADLRWRGSLDGEVTFHFAYTGKVSSIETQGIFRQQVGDDSYVISSFQPSDARRAFPCFDDPRFKIPWQLTIDAPKEFLSLADTPAVGTTETNGIVSTQFAETHPLPSYLVAFTVGPFDIVDVGPIGRNHTPFRVVTPRGLADQATFAAAATGPLLSRLEDYFDLPYQYEKLDVTPVPKGVDWAAMENPGLITTITPIYLWPHDEDSLQRQQAYASIMAHEMAHLWFGDFVTLPWWDDTWLNESFAEWLGNNTVNAWQPTWGIPTQRVRARSDAMALDSLTSARQVRQPVETEDDVWNAFDSITYAKGEAVLNAIEAWLGPDVFKNAMRAYMRTHPHGSGAYQDVVDQLSKTSGKDVGAVMSTFLDQPGVPVVSVDLDCNPSPVLHLSQKRYLPLGIDAEGDPTWKIPMCIRSDETVCTVLAERTADVPLAGACPTVVNADVGAVGYYRVAYSPPLLSALLADQDLSTVERVGVVDNATALASGGRLDAGLVLRATPDLAKDAPDVARLAMEFASSLDAHLVSSEQRTAYERFLRSTFGPVAHAWGLVPRPDEATAIRLARPTAVHLVALLGEDDALANEVVAAVNEWLTSRSGLDPSLVDVALAVAAHRGDKALFDRIHAAIATETDQHRHEQLISALGKFHDPALVRTALDLTLGDEIDVRDSFGLMRAAFTDPRSRDASWAWLETNVDRLAAKLPMPARPYLIGAGDAWCDPDHRAREDALFAERAQQWIGGAYALAQTNQKIDACIATRAAQAESVRAFLEAY